MDKDLRNRIRVVAETLEKLAKNDAWEVIVSNIGKVYSGNDPRKAKETYDYYIELSQDPRGRAGGEDVVLMHNGEIYDEYFGSDDEDEPEEEDTVGKVNAKLHKADKFNFNPKTVEEISRLTEGNHHGEALLLGAAMLSQSNIITKLKLVMKLHKLEGHMPKPLMDYRHMLYDEVMKAAKSLLDPEQFEKFHSAY